MNRKPTILRHWLATLLAAVCIPLGTQTAWADDDPFYAARTARTNNTFTFSQPAYNVETTVEYVDAKVSLTTDNDGTLYYLTLAEAIADADYGEIVTLLDNVTITEGLTINKEALVINLGGKTLTYTGTGAALEITDISAATISSGTITCTGDNSTGIVNSGALDLDIVAITCSGSTATGINNTGELDFSSSSITCEGTTSIGILNNNTGEVTVNSGSISCTGASSDGIYNYGSPSTIATLKVMGGSITGTMTGIDNKGTLTVTGGTITGTSNNGYGIYNSANATLTVSGGTITSTGTGSRAIVNDTDATLTISDTPTISANVTGGKGIDHSGTTFNLKGSPNISGTYVDISLFNDKMITINGALTAPTTGETPVADPWTVASCNIDNAPTTPYIFTSGWSAHQTSGTTVADPAAYFAYYEIIPGITTRLVDGATEGSKEAQFMLYVALDEDTKPTIANGGPAVETADGTREASTAGDFWVDDVLTATTTAQPADGITWQWYRKSGDADPVEITGATDAHIDGTSGNAYSQYTLTADDLGCTIIAKATMAANAAGTGYPGSAVTVASTATVAVEKKDNFGELDEIVGVNYDFIGVKFIPVAGVEYLVVADGVTPNPAQWALATTPTTDELTPGSRLTITQFAAVSGGTASLSQMMPGMDYDLYYRLVETNDTKAGTTATTYGKPVNQMKTDITTATWTYQITTGGVTYELSHDATTGMATTTTTAKAVAVPAEGDGTHKTASILASIPANNEQLVERIDVWSVLGYNVTSAEVGTGVFSSAIAVDANAFDNDMTLAAVGSTLDTYGYVKAFDDGMFAWLMSGTPHAICTEEGYQIYLMNGGYYAVCNASDEYAMAGKSKRIEETMSSVLTIDGLTGSDQGAVQFKDKVGTPLPISDTAPNTGKIVAAPGQKVTVEVTLPAGFGFKNNDDNKKITVTYSATTVEKTLASTSDTRVWTAEFDMPSSNVTVSFKEAEPLEGFDVNFDYTAPTAGGAVAAATGSPTADGTVKVLQTLTYTLTPTTPTADAEGAGYALTALGLPDGITPTIVLASNEETAVTLPTEQSVKVTFTVPATYTTTSTVTFAPVFTNTYENISFAAGNTTYKYSDTQGIALHGENADLTFCTVTGVSGSTVTTAEITSKQIPAGLPVIVQNASGAAIVARMDIGTYDAVTYDDTHFNGTVVAKTTTDSGYGPWHWADNMKYYGFNGLGDFVWINEAGNVAAHKCWLMIQTGGSGSSLARQLSVVWPDGSTTHINGVDADDEDGDWYDLNGRKLQAKPQRKGVYILNGQKKVVK